MAYIEPIQPANGRKESLWVLFAVVAILSAGTIGLSLNKQANRPVAKAAAITLSIAEKQLLMELTNALPEISFEQQASGQWPSLTDLARLGIEPFANELRSDWRWTQPDSHCYLSRPQTAHSGYFLLIPGDNAILFRRSEPDAHLSCQPDIAWVQLNQREDSSR
ncbi:DUF6162 family protein [Marinobacterium jannaschii]|uniref:DUF6162 family protein n=1 Tax=Marinobacterium jannaschii TaxID=64970 RepID=UPI000486D3FE|nr:hypothetical protein [Marinobacterium jannaschii]